ncbi:MAG: sulfatase-like hydrolase/transferase [Planctomycetota bacterium]
MATHVVLLMADQQRRDTIAAYGSPYGATPNLDAFAEEATVFDRAYCACPLCVPTRTAMYTGRYPHRNGVIVNGWTPVEKPYAQLREDVPTLYEQLAGAGYQVTHVGVDHCRSIPPIQERVPGMTYVANEHHRRYLAEQGLDAPDTSWTKAPSCDFDEGRPIMFPYTTSRTGAWPHEAEHFKDFFWAREAERIIAGLDPGRPQFIETLFWAPHVPLVAPEPYASMFEPKDIELPETCGVWCDGQPATLCHHLPGQFGAMRLREQWREPWAVYLGLCRLVDEAIGRVIAALKRRGIWDDALVIFALDHGEMMGSHACFQKMCMYEEATHIPLVIKPPGGRAVARVAGLASPVDIGPTISDALGIDPLPDGDGVSLVPMLEGDAESVRDELFIEFNGNSGRGYESRALVRGHWKYVYTRGDRDELYDLDADPAETVNRGDDPVCADTRAALRARLAEIMRANGDHVTIR